MRPTIDSHTRGTVVIDHATYSVHQGLRFKAFYLQPHGSELANDATLDILLKVGSRHIHAVPRLVTGGDMDLLIYKDTTTSNEGTPIEAVAKNQVDNISSGVTVFSAPTVTAPGTVLLNWFVPGGKKGPGMAWSEAQWILKCNTNYLFRITNRSGGAIQFGFSLGWMEE